MQDALAHPATFQQEKVRDHHDECRPAERGGRSTGQGPDQSSQLPQGWLNVGQDLLADGLPVKRREVEAGKVPA